MAGPFSNRFLRMEFSSTSGVPPLSMEEMPMIAALITLVIYLLVIGLVIWLLTYLIDAIPIPEPFRTVARTVLMVVGVLICIVLLLQFAGVSDGGLPRLTR